MYLFRKQILLVQEENERRFSEPPRVDDLFEQGQRLVHAVGGVILEQLSATSTHPVKTCIVNKGHSRDDEVRSSTEECDTS